MTGSWINAHVQGIVRMCIVCDVAKQTSCHCHYSRARAQANWCLLTALCRTPQQTHPVGSMKAPIAHVVLCLPVRAVPVIARCDACRAPAVRAMLAWASAEFVEFQVLARPCNRSSTAAIVRT
jgi:hypothetical protein